MDMDISMDIHVKMCGYGYGYGYGYGWEISYPRQAWMDIKEPASGCFSF